MNIYFKKKPIILLKIDFCDYLINLFNPLCNYGIQISPIDNTLNVKLK